MLIIYPQSDVLVKKFQIYIRQEKLFLDQGMSHERHWSFFVKLFNIFGRLI